MAISVQHLSKEQLTMSRFFGLGILDGQFQLEFNSQTVNIFRFTFDYLAMTSELAEKLMSTITLKAEEGEEEVSMNLGSSGDRTCKPSFNYIQAAVF